MFVQIHTLAGHYMYTELSGKRSYGNSARLFSPHVSMETTQTVCWRYYYHMFGRDAGIFQVGVSQYSIHFKY